MKLKNKLKYFLKYVILNPRKLLNFFLYKISKFFKINPPLNFPTTIMIEPTNICNLHCPLCPTGAGLIKREKGYISFNNFKKVFLPYSKYAFHLRLWNWGEPLLNNDLPEIISFAKSKNLFVNVSTNSSFLNKDISKKIIDSGLDELIISLDGASKETYKNYRKGGDFEKIIDSIKFLTSYKKKIKKLTPYIKLQFIIMKYNEHEIEKIKILSKKLGVDELIFKTVGIMDYSLKEDIKKYLPINKKYSRYSLEEGSVKSKNNLSNNCDFIWNEIVINWDGTVVPCCFDMNNSHVLGNSLNQSIKEIWKGEKYKQFRESILKNKKSIPLCKNCPGTNKETFVKVE